MYDTDEFIGIDPVETDKGPEVDEAIIHATAQAIIQALRHECVPPKEGISMSSVIEGVIKEMFNVLGISVKEKP